MGQLSKMQLEVWGQNRVPNTFIGGIAKTGGTGVNAPINTRALLAAKLGVLESRISGFVVTGNDVSFRITGNYTLADNLFGNNVSASANKNITSYLDPKGLLTSVGEYCFSRCDNFTTYLFGGNPVVGKNTFQYTKVSSAYLTSNWSSFETFRDCSLMTSVNATNLGGEWANTFRGTSLLLSITGGLPTKLLGTFIGSGILNYTSSTVLELSQYAFGLNCKVQNVTLPNCTKFSNSCFSHGGPSIHLKNVIAPKVTQTASLEFNNNTEIEIIDIRACKTMGTDVFLNALKSGVSVVKVHIFMKTSGAGGIPNANLTYAKSTRGATVEFYDDAGLYVSTL